MSSLNTTLSVTIEQTDADSLQLEADTRDGALNRPVQINYTDPPALFWQAMWSSFSDPPTRPEPWARLLEVVEPGQAHLRLYCQPQAAFELHLSEPPPLIAAVPEVRWADTGRSVNTFGKTAPPYSVYLPGKAAASPPAFESLGAREATEFEVLTFNFQREARLKRPHVASPELLYASIFIDRQGKPAAPPRPDPQQPGLFRAGEDVAGSLILRYNSHYRLLRVNYGLPGGALLDTLRHAWLRGDITQVEMPPLLAFAMAGRSAAQLRVERKVWPPGVVWSYFSNQAKEETGEKLLAETGRVTDTEKIVSAQDPGSYVEVERAREISLQDQQGRRWTMRLAGKT